MSASTARAPASTCRTTSCRRALPKGRSLQCTGLQPPAHRAAAALNVPGESVHTIECMARTEPPARTHHLHRRRWVTRSRASPRTITSASLTRSSSRPARPRGICPTPRLRPPRPPRPPRRRATPPPLRKMASRWADSHVAQRLRRVTCICIVRVRTSHAVQRRPAAVECSRRLGLHSCFRGW